MSLLTFRMVQVNNWKTPEGKGSNFRAFAKVADFKGYLT